MDDHRRDGQASGGEDRKPSALPSRSRDPPSGGSEPDKKPAAATTDTTTTPASFEGEADAANMKPPALTKKETIASAAGIPKVAAAGESFLTDATRVERFPSKVPSTPVGPDVLGPGHKIGAFYVRGMRGGDNDYQDDIDDEIQDDADEEEAVLPQQEATPPTAEALWQPATAMEEATNNVLSVKVEPAPDGALQAEIVPEDEDDPEAIQRQHDRIVGEGNATEALDVQPDEEGKEEETKRRLSKKARNALGAFVLLVFVVVSVVLGIVFSGTGPLRSEGNETDANKTGDNCFSTRDELVEAIDNYLVDSGPDSTTAQAYGHPIRKWCVEPHIENFEGVFNADRNPKIAEFNEPLDGWVMKSATRLASMFNGAASFNQNLSMWDVSRVVSLYGMFNGATKFNGDLSGWNTSELTDLSQAFYEANEFNSDISKWDVSKVTTLSRTFLNAKKFNQDLSGWQVSKVTDMSSAFWGTSVFNSDLGSWDVSGVTTMQHMFFGASVFNQDISNWDVTNVRDMSGLFRNAFDFNQNISKWDVSNVFTMRELLRGATDFDNDLSGWNTANVNDMSLAFAGATAFNQSLAAWDTSRVSTMRNMFQDSTGYNRDVSAWDVQSVTDFTEMFTGAHGFNRNLCSWGATFRKNALVIDMFLGTNCSENGTQTNLAATPPGPFCFVCGNETSN